MQVIVNCIIAFLANLILIYMDAAVVKCRLGHAGRILLALSVTSGNVLKVLAGDQTALFVLVQLIYAAYVLILVPICFFEGKLWKRILSCDALMGVQMLSDFLAFFFVVRTHNYNYTQWTPLELSYAYLASCSCFILFGVALVFLLRMLNGQRFKMYYLMFLSYLGGIWVLVMTYILEISGFWTLIGSGISIVVVVMLLYYTFTFDQKRDLELELASVQDALERETAYYRRLEENEERLSMLRHDYLNQITAIRFLIETGERKEAEKLIRKLKEMLHTLDPEAAAQTAAIPVAEKECVHEDSCL